MKPLSAYYSHSGNNAKLAAELRDRIRGAMDEIKERKNAKTFPFSSIFW